MNILIDIGHPAHVHYFRNLYSILKVKHQVTVTCKTVPIIANLLNHYQIPYINIGERGSNLLEKMKFQLYYTLKMRSILTEYSIDIAFGASALIVHAAKFTKTKTILFDDDDQTAQPLTAKFVTPCADAIVSPDVLSFERLQKAIYYPGYHELAYLHPQRYIPNPTVLENYGLTKENKFFILRFNAFKAHHDINEGGMTEAQKITLIESLLPFGKVFITTEAKLSPQFEAYKMPIAQHEMHDFMYYSHMLVSDSQTMSSEAAVLGTPSYRCNTFAGRLSVLEEEEKRYGLTKAFLPRQFDWMVERIQIDLQNPDLKKEWQDKRSIMLNDKIDVTAFWTWFIENYPDSEKAVRSNELDFANFT